MSLTRLAAFVRRTSRRSGASLANVTWLLGCLPESVRLRLAVRDVERSQRATLARILRRTEGTRFAEQTGLATSDSAEEFAARVPLIDYADVADALEEAACGTPNVLVSDPLLLLEPTGGSTGGTKLIPVTRASKAEFGRALAAWVADVYTHNVRALFGCAYFSLSPVGAKNVHTSAGIPVGFDADEEYFGAFRRKLVAAAQAVPADVRLVTDIESFRYVTAAFLLSRQDLTLVSVWNPTFMTLLLDEANANREALVADIAEGVLRPPSPLAPDLDRALAARFRADPDRAASIARAWAESPSRAEAHRRIWPNLRVVSCWCDAHAGRYATALARDLPQASISPKGLVATEGIVSIPIAAAGGSVLAARSHYVEFETIQGDLVRSWETTPGERYSVVLTSGAGLFRYRLRDTVEVEALWHSAPVLRFVGKESMVSDRFGEKISESHAQRLIEKVEERFELEVAWSLLAFEEFAEEPAYALFLDARIDASVSALVVETAEVCLAENFHYAYARRLGQLGPLRLVVVPDGAARFIARSADRGRRAGDVKPLVLSTEDGWLAALDGRVLGVANTGEKRAGPGSGDAA